VQKTSPSSLTFFSEGFVPHLAHHRFLSPEIGDIGAVHGNGVFFSPMNTTPTPHVHRPGLDLDLNHSFTSMSPAMRMPPVFFGDDPSTGSSTVSRALYNTDGWYTNKDPNGQHMFGDMAGSHYTVDEVCKIVSFPLDFLW
jgi:hypothetical protein